MILFSHSKTFLNRTKSEKLTNKSLNHSIQKIEVTGLWND